ncbi:MAG: tryptophan synthase subunit alpha [Thermodesulfobacteriota bacterium]|nr:tryptophan synthase subunit alpha [Thermodesulfobacteriota bacterium]
MNRIEKTFKSLVQQKKKALIPYITCGDPDLGMSYEIALELIKSGADLLELGVPFSDPTADGPTIQRASERALKQPFSMDDIMGLVQKIRKDSDIPLILFGYYNPFFSYGISRFVNKAKKAGVDGVLIVDLPPEESDEIEPYLKTAGLDMIFLLTPTSDTQRMDIISKKATGFIYYVSVTGVTGARNTVDANIRSSIVKIREFTDIPIGVGFGISNKKQAQEVSMWADAVIVGSALVKIIEEKRDGKALLKSVAHFVHELKEGMNG